jgi:hypothetical protein
MQDLIEKNLKIYLDRWERNGKLLKNRFYSANT